MDEATQQRLRRDLLADRDQQIAVLDEHGASAYSDDVGDLNIDTDSFADSAQATEERAELLGHLEFARDRVRSIDRALAGMDDGTYGVCADCGDSIPAERLEVRPLSVRCVHCAANG